MLTSDRRGPWCGNYGCTFRRPPAKANNPLLAAKGPIAGRDRGGRISGRYPLYS